MKRTTTTLLLLALLTTLALVAAPAALAKAEAITVTAIETWAGPPNPTSITSTGGVAHMTFNNHFFDAALVPDPALDPLYVGPNETHLRAVATLVDGQPTDAVIRGTFHKDCAAGEWDGTFNGTMSMVTGTWAITVSGRGTSGDVTGMTMRGTNVNATGAFGVVTVRILAPKGF